MATKVTICFMDGTVTEFKPREQLIDGGVIILYMTENASVIFPLHTIECIEVEGIEDENT